MQYLCFCIYINSKTHFSLTHISLIYLMQFHKDILFCPHYFRYNLVPWIIFNLEFLNCLENEDIMSWNPSIILSTKVLWLLNGVKMCEYMNINNTKSRSLYHIIGHIIHIKDLRVRTFLNTGRERVIFITWTMCRLSDLLCCLDFY